MAPTTGGDGRRLERKTFLAHGAAADIWLVETVVEPIAKSVSKIIRLDEETLRRHCKPKNRASVNKLWREFIRDIQSRVQRWSHVRHKNVVQVFELCEGLDLRVEFCSNGSASQFLGKMQSDPIGCRRKMILDTVKGVAHLHTRDPPIVHGSINLNKLFVDDSGTAKIGEFGLAMLTEHFGLLAPSIFREGLTRWMSPELIDPDAEDEAMVPTTSSDVWALGCTLFEIMSGKPPYAESKHELRVCSEIMSGEPPGRRAYCPPELDDIWPNLKMCWSFAPGSRPKAKELEGTLSRGGFASGSPEINPTRSEGVDKSSWSPSGANLTPFTAAVGSRSGTTAFTRRLGSFIFPPTTQANGWTSLVNNWHKNVFGQVIQYQFIMSGSAWTATPIIMGETHYQFRGMGKTRREAMANSAEMIARSGHC